MHQLLLVSFRVVLNPMRLQMVRHRQLILTRSTRVHLIQDVQLLDHLQLIVNHINDLLRLGLEDFEIGLLLNLLIFVLKLDEVLLGNVGNHL
jgi:hypothetical protein